MSLVSDIIIASRGRMPYLPEFDLFLDTLCPPCCCIPSILKIECVLVVREIYVEICKSEGYSRFSLSNIHGTPYWWQGYRQVPTKFTPISELLNVLDAVLLRQKTRGGGLENGNILSAPLSSEVHHFVSIFLPQLLYKKPRICYKRNLISDKYYSGFVFF